MSRLIARSVLPILLISNVACICGTLGSPSPQELHRRYLNLELPSGVSDFDGEGGDTFPVFATRAYFTYRAEPEYFEVLEQHERFIEESGFNERVHRVSCDSSEFVGDFSYWTEEEIELASRECFVGVFFPYLHYIVYDPVTEEVHHFVTGMSG